MTFDQILGRPVHELSLDEAVKLVKQEMRINQLTYIVYKIRKK